jgi:ABC-2 type transport system ATP-binding protein
MSNQDEIVIDVNKVYKDFILPHERTGSVKGIFTSMFREATKQKELQHALKDITFEIKKGEFFGIVGRNGSGKSTLLKILANIYQPTKGTISTKGRLVPFIELGVGFNPELSGRDNVYLNGAVLGFSKNEVAKMYDEIVEFAELERFMDQKLKNYSSGMQVRLAFSMAIRAKADILLVDEVLAVGDADFQRKCFNYFKTLKKEHKTVVFVTHDMSAVREFCDRAALINDSKLEFIGESSEAAREYSMLFMGEDKNEQVTSEDEKKRWGNGGAKFTDIQVKLVNDKIKIVTKVKVFARHIDKLIYGVHISAKDGSEIVATNNRMIDVPDVLDLSKDSEVKISWEMLNIYNDGQYYVTLTLVDDEQTVLDWYNEAESFTVRKLHRSTTAVMPPITVNSEVNKSNTKSDNHG